jgi:WXXGXW repeat (2 copies)
MKHPAIAAALLGATWILAGCVPESPPPPPPPAPVAETIPLPPVSATPLIWQPGHWDWTGSAYVWSPGQFVPREGHGEFWMQGFWERTQSGWVWHPAHWV